MDRRDFIKKVGMFGAISSLLPSVLFAKKEVPIEVLKKFFNDGIQELEKDCNVVGSLVMTKKSFKLLVEPLNPLDTNTLGVLGKLSTTSFQLCREDAVVVPGYNLKDCVVFTSTDKKMHYIKELKELRKYL